MSIDVCQRLFPKFTRFFSWFIRSHVGYIKWEPTGLPITNNIRKAQLLLEARLNSFQKEAAEHYRLETWGIDADIQDTLFADVIRQWLYRKQPSISLSTLEDYRKIVAKADEYFRSKNTIIRAVTPKGILLATY